MYLLGGAAIGPGGEREEHGVPQEGQVGVEPWRPEPRPQVDGQAALHQRADQLTEGPGQRVFLAAGLDLIELHLVDTSISVQYSKENHFLLC